MNPPNYSDNTALDKHPMTGCCGTLLWAALGASMAAAAAGVGASVFSAEGNYTNLNESIGNVLEMAAIGGAILGIPSIVIYRIISSGASDGGRRHHDCEDESSFLYYMGVMYVHLFFSMASGALGFPIFNAVKESSITFKTVIASSSLGGLINAVPVAMMMWFYHTCERSLNSEITAPLFRDVEQGPVDDSAVLPVSGDPGFLSAMKANILLFMSCYCQGQGQRQERSVEEMIEEGDVSDTDARFSAGLVNT